MNHTQILTHSAKATATDEQTVFGKMLRESFRGLENKDRQLLEVPSACTRGLSERGGVTGEGRERRGNKVEMGGKDLADLENPMKRSTGPEHERGS